MPLARSATRAQAARARRSRPRRPARARVRPRRPGRGRGLSDARRLGSYASRTAGGVRMRTSRHGADDARRPAGLRARAVRGLRERRPAGRGHRLRGRRREPASSTAELASEGKLGPVRWLSMLLGIAGHVPQERQDRRRLQRRRPAEGRAARPVPPPRPERVRASAGATLGAMSSAPCAALSPAVGSCCCRSRRSACTSCATASPTARRPTRRSRRRGTATSTRSRRGSCCCSGSRSGRSSCARPARSPGAAT